MIEFLNKLIHGKYLLPILQITFIVITALLG